MTNHNIILKNYDGFLFVISGPSGVGKDTVVSEIKKLKYPYYYPITITTRKPRNEETHGIHYYFVHQTEFQKLILQNQLLEWANVYGDLYGVPKELVYKALEKGEKVLLKLDVQGALKIKSDFPKSTLIFITAPDSELKSRLMKRMTETNEKISQRLETAKKEKEMIRKFDYTIDNKDGDLKYTVSKINQIIDLVTNSKLT
jgi:guanylate kinase